MNLYHLNIPIMLQDQNNQESARALTLTVQAPSETAALSLVSGALQQMIYFSANGVRDIGTKPSIEAKEVTEWLDKKEAARLQAEVRILGETNKMLSERCTRLEQAAGRVLRVLRAECPGGGPLSGLLSGLEQALRGDAEGPRVW